MRTNSLKYAPSVEVKVSIIATVGPKTNTSSAKKAASSKLACDNHFTPRCTPVTAEIKNSAVTTTIITACQNTDTGKPNTVFKPLLICDAPIPSDAATPKAVATTAITLNTGESCCAQRHGKVLVAELTKALLPRRN